MGGLDRLRCLRDLTVRIEVHYKAGRCCPVPFRVQFREGQGLSVDLSEKIKKEPKQHEALNQHLEQTEQRQQAKGWQGEGDVRCD